MSCQREGSECAGGAVLKMEIDDKFQKKKTFLSNLERQLKERSVICFGKGFVERRRPVK